MPGDPLRPVALLHHLRLDQVGVQPVVVGQVGEEVDHRLGGNVDQAGEVERTPRHRADSSLGPDLLQVADPSGLAGWSLEDRDDENATGGSGEIRPPQRRAARLIPPTVEEGPGTPSSGGPLPRSAASGAMFGASTPDALPRGNADP
jgi:hypothetical protein